MSIRRKLPASSSCDMGGCLAIPIVVGAVTFAAAAVSLAQGDVYGVVVFLTIAIVTTGITALVLSVMPKPDAAIEELHRQETSKVRSTFVALTHRETITEGRFTLGFGSIDSKIHIIHALSEEEVGENVHQVLEPSVVAWQVVPAIVPEGIRFDYAYYDCNGDLHWEVDRGVTIRVHAQ